MYVAKCESSKYLFGLSKCTVAYLINTFPTTALERKTLVDIWLGYPPNLKKI